MGFFRKSDKDKAKEVLERLNADDMDSKFEASEDVRSLDYQYPEIVERLKYLKDEDPEKKVRKSAKKTLDKIKKKPMADPLITKTVGQPDTGFDDEIGDSSLEEGELDVESDLSKEEEDRREAEAEGKGIAVKIKETNIYTLDYQGQIEEQGSSTGKITVRNSGTKNRINGIDLYLDNTDILVADEPISEHYAIGKIQPGEKWSKEYSFDQPETDIILVEQVFVDPETDVAPNFRGQTDKQFENRITITNTLDRAIHNVRGTRVLNEHATLVSTSGDDGIDFNEKENRLIFTIDSIDPGEMREVVVTLSATLPEDEYIYTSGSLDVVYDVEDNLTSGLTFRSVDGVSDIKQKIRKKQREKEPRMFDCEVMFENLSEFVYQIKEFEVRRGDINGPSIMEWKGGQATEDEREIVPGERVVFEFVFEDIDGDGNPDFGQHLEFEVQEYRTITSEFKLSLPGQQLRFMALEVSKTFVGENDKEIATIEIPSYMETEIPSIITVKGVGTFPLEAIEISDEIPVGFRFDQQQEFTVTRDSIELDDHIYTVEVVETEETDRSTMRIVLEHLEETVEGRLDEGDTIAVQYSIFAEYPEPREEPLQTTSFAEGYVYEMPENRVRDEVDSESLIIDIIHVRDDLDLGKYVHVTKLNGDNAFDIELTADNYGSSTQTLVLKDLVPAGFEVLEDSIASSEGVSVSGPENVEGGNIYTWTFENVKPGSEISTGYTLRQLDKDAPVRELNKVFQG